MVDHLNPGDPVAQEEQSLLPAEGKQGILSSASGRIALIAGAIVLLLVIVAVVAFLILPMLAGDGGDDSAGTDVPAAPGAASTAADESTEAFEPDDVPLNDVFTFRDVFQPLFTALPSVDASASADSSQTVDPDVLYLQDVVTEDGVSRAVLLLGGATYTLADGEGISGTPWQVLTVSENSVVMLYGDGQVTLSIGQGVSSDGSVGTSK